jgi:protein-S-isoprenylcysteine O-methyltransferase Ste14
VRVPPVAAALVVGVAMRYAAVALEGGSLRLPGGRIVAIVLAIAGAGVALAGVLAFRRVDTTPDPMRPERATQLVVDGIYGHTRNPMYLGLALALAGWALWLDDAWALAGVPVFVAWMDRLQIPAEERALASIFGAQYDAYRGRVRRWL